MDFLEPLLIWIASCFPFFIPLIVPVGSYGFYKHGPRHTDGTDDIQDATAAQKGLITAARVSKLDSLITDPIGVDGVAGRHLRGSFLKIEEGTEASTLKCTLSNRFNGDIIAVTDNIAKNATTGYFTLDANGYTLKIEAAGLTGNVVYAFGVFDINTSGVDLTAYVYATGNDISITLLHSTSATSQDMTVLAATGVMYLELLYMTNA